MKIRFYLAMAAAALLMTNCSQDEPLVQEKGSTNTLTATIEGASRSSVTDGGVFSWNNGDAIAVGNKSRTFTKFVSDADGVFSATESILPTDYAIYPFDIAPQTLPESGNLPTVTLPATYEYGSTHAPMLATIGQNATSLQFKHLAGLMRFKVKNVPAGADSFVLTTKQQTITGDFTPVQNGTEVQINQTGDATQSVTIKFASLDAQKDEMTFYIPMPVGEYQNLHVKIAGEGLTNDGLASGTGVMNTITRGKLLLMPTMVCDNTGDITLVNGANEGSSIELENNSEVDLAVASGDNVVVEMTNGAEATLNLIAADASNAELTISDGNGATTSQSSTATLNVTAENVSTLKIEAPTLTVELAEGTYDRVEALTAQQTLIIGGGVTINQLVVNGGNVVVEGTVNLITPKDKNVRVTMTNWDGRTLVKPMDMADAKTQVLYEVYNAAELAWVLRNWNGDVTSSTRPTTIELMEDIDFNGKEIYFDMNEVGGFHSVTLEGNNHTIKNYKVEGVSHRAALFPQTSEITIQNVTIDGAVVGSEQTAADLYSGALIAIATEHNVTPPAPYTTTIRNVTVQNSFIKGVNKVGGLVGQANGVHVVSDVVVTNTSIGGYGADAGSLGGLYGYLKVEGESSFTNSEMIGGAIICSDGEDSPKRGSSGFIGTLAMKKANSSLTLTGCRVENTNLDACNTKNPLNELVGTVREGNTATLTIDGETINYSGN